MINDIIIVTGLHETIAGLKAFDQEALKKFEKVINTELRQAKNDAQELVIKMSTAHGGTPMSGWRKVAAKNPGKDVRGGQGWPAWDVGKIQAGISSSKAQRKPRRDYTTSAGALLNKDAAGAIFELAGRNKDGKTKAGKQFINVLNERFGKASRIIYRIVDRDRLKIQRKFVEALDQAKIDLQKALESQKAS